MSIPPPNPHRKVYKVNTEVLMVGNRDVMQEIDDLKEAVDDLLEATAEKILLGEDDDKESSKQINSKQESSRWWKLVFSPGS